MDAVLGRWLPDGKREGAEWVALNPTRSDHSSGSFSVNMRTGAWSDFATADKGGDLIALVAYIDGVGQSEGCNRLAQFLRIADTSNAAPVKAPGTAYKVVVPVPDAALRSIPKCHPSHGTPSAVWDYSDSQGRMLFRVCRFDGIGPRGKTYAPLSYGEDAKGLRWQWKALPAPRPLYRLPDICTKPTAIVILCEGEKSADAAALLFPDAAVSAWSGGAKAIKETDFTPLKGREVIFWPDNDGPGKAATATLQIALVGVANSLRVLNLDAFKRYSPQANGSVAPAGGYWPEKADAADAIAAGWTSAHMVALETEIVLFCTSVEKDDREVEADDESRASALFVLKSDGLYRRDGENFRRLAAPLHVLARSRDRYGKNWGMLVRFSDHDAVEKLWNIPMSMFASEHGSELIRGLLDRGLEIMPGREPRRYIPEYLQGYQSGDRVTLVESMGWHGPAFMLPHRVIGTLKTPLHYYSDAPAACKLSSKGTVAEWRDNIAVWCVGNPQLCFAVAIAFATPLLDVFGTESFGIHFVGDSSAGKSTVLKVAASVCGHPGEYPRTWRATDNALEATAAAHSDCLLVLDEIGQSEPRIIGEIIYMLGNGEGKARATDRGGVRDIQHRWRLAFISSGEKTLHEHMAEANRKPQTGMELRFMSLPACLHSSETDRRRLGIYQHIGNFENGAALSDHLLRECAKYHGSAFEAFLEGIVSMDRTELAHYLQESIANFSFGNLSQQASGQVHRAASKFALVAAAGELATKYGITGWKEGEASTAARTCFHAWLDMRGGDGNLEEQKIIGNIRHHFEVYGESRYSRWESEDARTDEHQPRTMERYGFRRTEERRDALDGNSTESVYYVLPEAFRSDVCKGFDHKRVARVLSSMGALRSEKDRMTGKARLPGAGTGPVACYIVHYAALCSSNIKANEAEK